MRDFSWKYFAMTGDVDAYLLYKQAAGMTADEAETAAAAQLLDETDTYEENE
ncbi:hypothetical protein FHS19_001970 [Paenibacillus rhizosphaerae]|uniref:YqzL family protein n=1 Tax=Paenibacillus rhizosphaerae TaxID=297318 RepID=A0A839TKL4_9BACL|nr:MULTISPECIES: YqzL family protein [Paenibacillus]MBB3127316.1 hypothetical protein [Paenibacillus rhizosphaerae]OZB91686.1 YqzL family protein [Paenibacillus sp. XY044]